MKQRNRPFFLPQPGFQILEIIIALGLISTLLIVIISAKKSTQLQQNTYYRTVARQLVVEEYEALRSASYATLTEDRTNQPFMDVAYNAGSWKVDVPGEPCSALCSGGNAMNVSGVSGTNNPSRAVVPAGWLGDGTYDLHFRPQGESSPDWGAGMYLRYRDDRNYYLLQATAATLAFKRISRGTTVPLWSMNQAFDPDTWYQLKVVANGLVFAISLNGTLLTTIADAIPLKDPPLNVGQFVLHAENGVVADFDDVTFTKTADRLPTLTWNFNGTNEVVGTPAYGWRRIGPGTLPSGTTALTISHYVNGGTTYTDLKTVVLTVSWQERNATRSVTNTFYINEQSSAP